MAVRVYSACVIIWSKAHGTLMWENQGQIPIAAILSVIMTPFKKKGWESHDLPHKMIGRLNTTNSLQLRSALSYLEKPLSYFQHAKALSSQLSMRLMEP